MSNSIIAQRVQYIKDAKVKDTFDNLVAAFERIYGDKMPEDLIKEIDEKSKQFN